MLAMLDTLRAVVPEAYDSVEWLVLLNGAEEEMAQDFADLCVKELEMEGGADAHELRACLVFGGFGQLL